MRRDFTEHERNALIASRDEEVAAREALQSAYDTQAADFDEMQSAFDKMKYACEAHMEENAQLKSVLQSGDVDAAVAQASSRQEASDPDYRPRKAPRRSDGK